MSIVLVAAGIIDWLTGSILGVAESFLKSDQYQVTISHSLPSPCPPTAGTCLGTKTADVDGDGTPDQVGVTYKPDACQNGVTSSCQITIHVVLDNGNVVEGSIPWTSPGEPTSLHFYGLSDLKGDGKSEVFVWATGACSLCSLLYVYELKQGALQPLQFSDNSRLAIANTSVGAGFTCQVVNGKHQVLSVVMEGIDQQTRYVITVFMSYGIEFNVTPLFECIRPRIRTRKDSSYQWDRTG